MIFGYAAALFMVLGYLPQAIYTIRTRDTDGPAMPTFLSLVQRGVFCIVQGFMHDNWRLVITNLITATCSAIVFGIKIHNDYFRNE